MQVQERDLCGVFVTFVVDFAFAKNSAQSTGGVIEQSRQSAQSESGS